MPGAAQRCLLRDQDGKGRQPARDRIRVVVAHFVTIRMAFNSIFD
jgi:hypothetical protein